MFEKIQGDQSKEQERKHYNAMLDEIDKLDAELSPTFPTPLEQPVHNVLQVAVKVRAAIPAFKNYVARIVDGVGENVKVIFREVVKDLDRILQKGILKIAFQPSKKVGPDVDCCKVLDVFGCLIESSSFEEMETIVRNMRTLAKDPQTKGNICRSNNRWEKGTSGGWRDYMTNVSIDGVIFEIQVVHRKMMIARDGLDGHTSFEKFRLQIEMLDHVQPKQDAVLPASGEDAYDVTFSTAHGAHEHANDLRKLLPKGFNCFAADDIDQTIVGFKQAQWFRANQQATATVIILTKV